MESSLSETERDNDVVVHLLDDFPDTSSFLSKTTYPALRIPVKRTADLRRQLGKHLLQIPRMKKIYDDPQDPKQYRILVLNSYDASNHEDVTNLMEEESCITATRHTIEIAYEHLTTEEALKIILKGKVQEIPTAFEIIGKLAHINLRDDCLPYKYWIGKVVLDKNTPSIRTVVNKIGTIDNVYRTFGMEVIAGFKGKDWSIVNVAEERCNFQLDFQQVYWNSRLAGEHKRLVQYILAWSKNKTNSKRKTVVADVMAGVGPFAVPLTAHQNPNDITVHANDLNPSSFHFLKINSTKNHCQQLFCYNEDGRFFIRHLQEEQVHVDHYLMNLPATAPEFLNAFQGYKQLHPEDTDSCLPYIHVHCFAPKASEKEHFYQCAVDRCAKALGCPLDREADQVNIHVVRDVSPGKNMLCLSFRLPRAVIALSPIELGNVNQQHSAPIEMDVKVSPSSKTNLVQDEEKRAAKRSKKNDPEN